MTALDAVDATETIDGPGVEAPGAHEDLLQFLYTAPVGLLDLDEDGRIRMCNPATVRLLLPLSASGGFDNLFELLADRSRPLQQAVASDPRLGLIGTASRMPPMSGSPDDAAAPALVSVQLFRVRPGRLMAVVWDDADNAASEARRLALAERQDSLTGLWNRDGLRAALAARRGDAAALLTINLDRFATINDAFGRPTGDEVLRIVGARLRATLRGAVPDHPGDDGSASVVARTGADEFAVLIHGVRDVADIAPVCRRLLRRIGEPIGSDGRLLKVSASAGVRLFSPIREDADPVLQDAELAMLEAKRAGRDRYTLFAAPLREAAERRGRIETDLRLAIERGELFVVYQPIVDLAAGELSSVEALVRWRHPERGVIPPGDFIEIAEASGLIAPLGDQVLDQACAALARLSQRFGPRAPRTVAVNVSRAQLVQAGFAERVLEVISTHGIPAPRLQLEVTESQAAQDALVQRALHELRSLGVTLALDDFGTGYSSLACLQSLPLDCVKIDRSFVARLEDSEHHRVLVQATLMVARSLGLATVAEGIESEAQASVVRSLGCLKGQGYLYARPLDEQALAEWIEARTS